MAEHYSSFDRGGTRWLLQRLTAVFLIGALAFHFLLLHFVNHAAEITFLGTRARMNQEWYLVTMWLFLLAGTFHGVNGVYNALINQGLTGRAKDAVKWFLVLVSLALIAQGTWLAVSVSTVI